jgi:hypothetical protein
MKRIWQPDRLLFSMTKYLSPFGELHYWREIDERRRRQNTRIGQTKRRSMGSFRPAPTKFICFFKRQRKKRTVQRFRTYQDLADGRGYHTDGGSAIDDQAQAKFTPLRIRSISNTCSNPMNEMTFGRRNRAARRLLTRRSCTTNLVAL